MAEPNDRHPQEKHEPGRRETELLWRYLDRINAGEEIDTEEILREHPDVGSELVAQLEAFQELSGSPKVGEPLGDLGDYTLRREIGRGGMGVVYDAWQNSMNRRVALKVLPVGVAADRRAFTRFMREAQAAGQLSHPNVAAVHALGIDEKTPYYAMEFVEGETLAQVLRTLRDAEPEAETPFGNKNRAGYFEKLAETFADVTDGLQHAHSKGVVHRDIKPSNLMLNGEGRLRILDFGLAHLEGQESLTLSGDLVGTPLYMSPEQARREKVPVGHRTDIYSLGATMYEMLTGRPPFKGKDHHDTLSRIVERDPTEPRKLNPRIPSALETVVLKCLRKNPGDRYGTAEALGQDLRRFVRGNPVEARPEAQLDRLLRRWRRDCWRVVAAACVSVLIAVTAVVFLKYRTAENLRAQADYGEIVERAALALQRQVLLGEETTGNIDLVDPRISNVLKYCLPELFERFELAPPADLIRDIEGATRLVRGRPEAFYYLGRAFALLGEQQRVAARVCLDEALERDPSFVPARFLRDEILGVVDAPWIQEILEATEPADWRRDWLEARMALGRFAWIEAARAFDRLQERSRRGEEMYLGAEAEIWLGAAKAHLGAGDVDEAIDGLTVAHRYLWPEAVQPALLLARAHLLAGQPERADKLFEAISERIAPGQNGGVLIGAIYLSHQDTDRALRWTERIRDPTNRNCATAEILMQRGEYEKAEAMAREAVSRARDRPWCHLALAGSLVAQGKFSEAAKACQQSIDLDTGYAPAYKGLGNCLCAQKRWEEGIANLRKAVRLDPGYVMAHFALGRALMLSGRLEEAKEALERATAIYPTSPRFHSALGFVYMRMGRHAEAIARHELTLKLRPRFAPAFIHLAIARARRNQACEAVQLFAEGLRLDPFGPLNYPDLVELFLRSERLDCSDALAELIEVVEDELPLLKGPTRLGAVATLALANFHLRTVEKALEWSREGLTLTEGRHPDLLLVRARVLLSRGENDAARQALTDASDLALGTLEPSAKDDTSSILPTDDTILTLPYLRLAEALRQTGDAGRAAELLRRVLEDDPRRPLDLWNLWLSLSFVEGAMSPTDVLKQLPGAPSNGPAEEEATDTISIYRREVEWLLTRLGTDALLRLHTDDDNTSRPGRAKSFRHVLPRIAYRVPLPPGIYRLRVQLSDEELETATGPDASSVITAEGEPLEGAGGAGGRDSGDVLTRSLRVTDGLLDVDVGDDLATAPAVRAIEIERIE